MFSFYKKKKNCGAASAGVKKDIFFFQTMLKRVDVGRSTTAKDFQIIYQLVSYIKPNFKRTNNFDSQVFISRISSVFG